MQEGWLILNLNKIVIIKKRIRKQTEHDQYCNNYPVKRGQRPDGAYLEELQAVIKQQSQTS